MALGDDGRLQGIIKTIPKNGYLLNKYFLAISFTPTEFVSADTSDNDHFLPKEQTESDNLKTMAGHIFWDEICPKWLKSTAFSFIFAGLIYAVYNFTTPWVNISNSIQELSINSEFTTVLNNIIINEINANGNDKISGFIKHFFRGQIK